MFVVGIIGFVGSLIAFLFSFIPPEQIAVGSPTSYVIILIALAIFFVLLPFIIFANRQEHWKDEAVAFAPFTWELEDHHLACLITPQRILPISRRSILSFYGDDLAERKCIHEYLQ